MSQPLKVNKAVQKMYSNSMQYNSNYYYYYTSKSELLYNSMSDDNKKLVQKWLKLYPNLSFNNAIKYVSEGKEMQCTNR